MPFYQYNSFTGRLKQSTYLQPLYPVSSQLLDITHSPKMIWDSIKTKPASISTSSAAYSTVPTKLLANFKKFQLNIEKPVYLLGGTPDKILIGITAISILGGLVLTCIKSYEMAHPAKN